MVLISLMMACLQVQDTATTLPPAPISTVVTLAAPESAAVITAPVSVQAAINTALKARGLNIVGGATAAEVQSQGTPSGRMAAMLAGSDGRLSVLIDATARPRAELSGRYPWQIDLTITVAETDRTPLTDRARIPVSLSYIHQDEADALAAASLRIARRTSLLVERFRRDQK